MTSADRNLREASLACESDWDKRGEGPGGSEVSTKGDDGQGMTLVSPWSSQELLLRIS